MIKMSEAVRLYNEANDAGRGYAPHSPSRTDESIDGAIEVMVRNGWEVVLERHADTDVAVLVNDDGKLVAIGGDSAGNNAWACKIEVKS